MKTILKNIGTAFLRLLSLIWQLPQTIVGLIALLYYSPVTVIETNGDIYYLSSRKMNGAISLGQIVIFPEYVDGFLLGHEYGHCVQSRILGWLYLPIIGIPSFVWACLHKYNAKYSNKDYYSFYTEKWANKLGKVR